MYMNHFHVLAHVAQIFVDRPHDRAVTVFLWRYNLYSASSPFAERSV